MGSIGRYIFGTTFGAFVVVLVSLTTLMWITQALRNFDLMTSQGQTILVFIGITGLIIPMLIQIIAPIALMIAVAHTLNRLSNDSELIVMNAAGMSPNRLLRPFMAVAVVVSLMVAAISIYISPLCLRTLRTWASEVRAELMTNVAVAGRFTNFDGKVTLHVRERESEGRLVGILVDDQRDPKERITILAEQGAIRRNERGVILVLDTGTVQRHEAGQRDPNIFFFNQYGFDLSSFLGGTENIKYSTQERYFSELYNQVPGDPRFTDPPEHARAEIHNRITAPFYPLAIMMITFAYLAPPRTTRQSRAWSLAGAIAMVALVRGAGLVGTMAGIRTPAALLIPYFVIIASAALGYWSIATGLVIEPPAFIANAVNALFENISRRFARATGQTA